MDARNEQNFFDYIRRIQPNYIVNYIAQGMVSESWLNPEDWYKTNVVAQVKIYKELSNFKFIKKFITYISR